MLAGSSLTSHVSLFLPFADKVKLWHIVPLVIAAIFWVIGVILWIPAAVVVFTPNNGSEFATILA